MKNDWKECKLGDIIVLNYGKGLIQEKRRGGVIPVYSSAGITGRHNEALVKSEGLIIGRKGTIGKVYYSATPFYCIDTAYYIEPKDEIYNLKFFYYLIQTLNLEELNEDSAVPGLNRETAYSQEILLPPLATQRAIAGVLGALDAKIDLLHRQNQTLESLAETLFRQWFVEEAGEDWEGTLSEYVKIQGGYAFKSSDFKEAGEVGIVKITNISMSSIDIFKTQFVDLEVVSLLDKEKFKISSGDFLIAMTGAEIGKIGIVEKNQKKLYVNQRVGKLIPKVLFGDIVCYLALKSREGQDHIQNTASGSAQENISTSGLESMAFPIYNPEKTNSFGRQTQPIFSKIIFNLAQIRQLSALRDALLPKLMNGEAAVAQT